MADVIFCVRSSESSVDDFESSVSSPFDLFSTSNSSSTNDLVRLLATWFALMVWYGMERKMEVTKDVMVYVCQRSLCVIHRANYTDDSHLMIRRCLLTYVMVINVKFTD